MQKIIKYFPDLTAKQINQFSLLYEIYKDWNIRVNIISRKDMDNFYEHHVLHSLGIAKVIFFKPETKILDVGTGGGFPGIPLAILFPESSFYLIDGIRKKIRVVKEVSKLLGLNNVFISQKRAETFTEKVDFVVCRAVTQMDIFVPWIKKNISLESKHKLINGILYLKGGDLTSELKMFPNAKQIELKKIFKSSFFETKKVVYLPL